MRRSGKGGCCIDAPPKRIRRFSRIAHERRKVLELGQDGTPSRRVADVFVRHGSKSEKWNQDDVREINTRVVAREKERWLADVLPDIRAAISAAPVQPTIAQLDPAAVVRTDAETFERTITSIVRRSS